MFMAFPLYRMKLAWKTRKTFVLFISVGNPSIWIIGKEIAFHF